MSESVGYLNYVKNVCVVCAALSVRAWLTVRMRVRTGLLTYASNARVYVFRCVYVLW